MAIKNQLGWWVAATVSVGALALGGAFYRAQQTIAKQHDTITYLRDQQAKIGELSDQSNQKLASEVARLEQELVAAQNAQRELTEQSFTNEAALTAATQELETLKAAPAPQAAEAPASPFPAFLALKHHVLAGEPYQREWEALQHHAIPFTDEVNQPLAAHVDGVASLEVLKSQLKDAYDAAHHVTPENPVLARLSNVISIRKLDAENEALRDAVMKGDIATAATLVREDADYHEWLEALAARTEVQHALDLLEQQLVGADG